MKKHLLFIILLTIALQSFFAFVDWYDWEHDAVLMKPAVDLLEGKMLFKQSFCQYGALAVLLPAAAMAVFGKYLLVLRLQVALFYAGTAVLLWLIWRRFMSSKLATFSVVIWNLFCFHWLTIFLPWSSSYGLFFQALAIYFFIRALETTRFRFYFWAGVSAGLVAFCKQNIGAYLFISLMGAALVVFLREVSWKKNILKTWTLLSLGFVSVFALFIAWFFSRGAFQDWWIQSVEWPAAWIKLVGGGFNPEKMLRDLLALYDWPPVYNDWQYTAIPLANLCVLFFYFWQLKKRTLQLREKIILVVCFAGVASWLQYYPVAAPTHVWWGATPIFGIFSFFLYKVFFGVFSRTKISMKNQRALFVIFLVVIFLPRIIFRAEDVDTRILSKERVFIHAGSPLDGIWVEPRYAAIVERYQNAVNDLVNSQSSSPDVVMLERPGMYLLLVHNHQPFHPIWAGGYWELYKAVYKDFPQKLDEHIRTTSPVIFAARDHANEILKGYPGYKVVAYLSDEFIILKKE